MKINHQKEKDWEKKFNIEECKWDQDSYDDRFITYANFFIGSVAVLGGLALIAKICRVQHGKSKLNFLSLRPWRFAVLTMFFVAMKAITDT